MSSCRICNKLGEKFVVNLAYVCHINKLILCSSLFYKYNFILLLSFIFSMNTRKLKSVSCVINCHDTFSNQTI